MDPAEQTLLLAREIEQARRVVAFTGAGISTECGIPDFRSRDRAWARNPPMPLQEFLASEDNQILSWSRKFAMDDLHGDARPGRGHRALARLYERGALLGVITQNIDGLHQAAGMPPESVVELHGNGTYATCLTCGVHHAIPRVRAAFEATGKAPRCLCGGIVKTATISFGQQMPAEAMRRAREMTMSADLFLAIGSSLVVYPAAAFPMLASENGAGLVILNRDPTPLDDAARLVLRGDIGGVLAPLGA